MSLSLKKADSFISDFEEQFEWYARKAEWEVAWRYLKALNKTLEQLALYPQLGRVRRFSHPELKGIRSFRVQPPFNKHLIFYRFNSTTLIVERILHGARELSRRLREPPAKESS